MNREIPVDRIGPNPYQPRRQFKEDEIANLAQSISREGFLQPLIVAPASDSDAPHEFVLIAGERRLRAAKHAGLAAVPCTIRPATKQQMLEWALVENIHREDLNPVERAAAYRQYMDRFSISPADVAERLGQPRTSVANYLRILDLCDALQAMLIDGQLTFGHAKVLAALGGDSGAQLELARRTVNQSLSVRQLEVLVAAKAAGAGTPAAPRPAKIKPAHVRDIEEQMTRAMGLRVHVHQGRGKHRGRVVVEYGSLDDFDRICAALGVRVEG